MLTERRQSHKSTYCIILFILIYRIGKYLKTASRLIIDKVEAAGRVRGKQERGMPASAYGISSWGTEKVLKVVCGIVCTTL